MRGAMVSPRQAGETSREWHFARRLDTRTSVRIVLERVEGARGMVGDGGGGVRGAVVGVAAGEGLGARGTSGFPVVTAFSTFSTARPMARRFVEPARTSIAL